MDFSGPRSICATLWLALALMLAGVGPAAAHAPHPTHPRKQSHVRHNPRGHMLGVVGRRTAKKGSRRAAAAAVTNLSYHSGPVVHSHRVHAIFWQPPGTNFGSNDAATASYSSLLTQFFADVAHDSGRASNVYQSDTQYSDTLGKLAYSSAYAGAITTTDPFPSNGCTPDAAGRRCLSDAQLQHELTTVISANGLPTGLGDIYFLFTPSGVDSCDGADCSYNTFCAYHSNFALSSQQVLYANMPYPDIAGCASGEEPNATVADDVASIASHEHNETITDPLGTGWWDSSNGPDSGMENGDKCAWTFGTALGGGAGAQYNQLINGHHYYLQQEWSNTGSACVLTMPHAAPLPQLGFSPQTPATSQTVSFDATGSSSAGGDPLTYSWRFGDASAQGSGITPTHQYATAGSYTVALTVSDSTSSATVLTTLVADTPPSCTDAPAVTVANNVSVSVPLVCTDSDGDPITRTITASPAHGALGTVAGGAVAYTPTAGYVGADTFSFQATDSFGRHSAPATVTIAVTQPPATQTNPPAGTGTTGTTGTTTTQPPAAPATPQAPTVTTTQKPALVSLGSLLLAPRRFTAAHGSVITWGLASGAKTSFRVEHRVRGVRSGGRCVASSRHRHGAACWRWVLVKSLSANGNAGTNHLSFRLRRLAPGRYRIVGWTTNSAGTGPVRQATFTIVRR